MKLFITILLINFAYLFGDKFGSIIHKKHLRGMYKEYREGQSLKIFEMTFDNIFDKIIESAKNDKNEYRFSIMCHPLEYSSNTDCEIHNILKNKEWSRDHPYITNKQIRNKYY